MEKERPYLLELSYYRNSMIPMAPYHSSQCHYFEQCNQECELKNLVNLNFLPKVYLFGEIKCLNGILKSFIDFKSYITRKFLYSRSSFTE